MRTEGTKMPLNILFVDRGEARETLQDSLTQALGELDFGHARNEREALLEMDRKKPGLIITNLETQGSEGRNFLRKILEHRGDQQPVVALSERITSDLLAEFLKNPMVWFVQNPAAPGEIADLAGQLLKG